MFKNLRFYRIQSEWPDAEDELSGLLENALFKPCSAFSESSLGFEQPVTNAGDLLCRRLAGADLIQLRLQSRVLPTAVVKEQLEERIIAFKSRTTRDPSRKEKRDLKEEVYADLLPKALLKSDRIRAFYVHSEKILAIATPSANGCERILDTLRAALGSLLAVPMDFKTPVTSMMNDVFLGNGPTDFGLGRECRMKDISDPKAKVTWLDMDLGDPAVRKHVTSGLTIDRLGMQFDGVLRYSVDEETVLRKIRLEGIEDLDDLDDEDPLARHDAEFTLYCGLLTKLLRRLNSELGVMPA